MPMFVTVMTLFASQFLGSTNQPRNRSAACGAARLRNRISFKVSTSCTQSATTRLPAARMTSPVIQADSSDARNTASGAISLTRPSRPSGVLSARTAAAPSECAVEDCRIWRQHHVWHRLQPYIEIGPFQAPWIELFTRQLQQVDSDTNITLYNSSQSGADSNWAKGMAQRLRRQLPLVW